MQPLFRPRPKRFFNYEKHKISCLYLEPYVVISLLVVSVGGNMERRRLAGIGIAVPFHRDKISEYYDQLTNPTLKKVRTTIAKNLVFAERFSV